MKFLKFILAFILTFPIHAKAQSQGCLYNGVLYPSKNGTVIVNQFGSCPANTSVYTGSTTRAYVSSSAQCPGGNTSTVVLGNPYTGPGQTKCVVYFSGTGSYVCSNVYNYFACPLDSFSYVLILVLGLASAAVIRKSGFGASFYTPNA